MILFLKQFIKRGFVSTFSYHGFQLPAKIFWNFILPALSAMFLFIMISVLL